MLPAIHSNLPLLIAVFVSAVFLSNQWAIRPEKRLFRDKPDIKKTADIFSSIASAICFVALITLDAPWVSVITIFTNLVMLITSLRGYKSILFNAYLNQFFACGGMPEEFNVVRKTLFSGEQLPPPMSDEAVYREYRNMYFGINVVQTVAVYAGAALVFQLIDHKVWNSWIFTITP